MGYPKGNLTTRAVVKPWSYTVIPPEGRVKNVLPFFEGFSTTILASPKYGASFVFYISTVEPGARTTRTWSAEEGRGRPAQCPVSAYARRREAGGARRPRVARRAA